MSADPAADIATSVDAVVRNAVDASRRWARALPAERAGWLSAIADAVDRSAERLVLLADEETHLGTVRLTGELARTTMQLRKFARVVTEGAYLEATIDHADPEDVPPHPDLRCVLVPLGPVVVWAASNFPFAFSVLGGDTASALAAGNAVIVKVHEGHQRLSAAMAAVARDALGGEGAPPSSIQLVRTRDVAIAVLRHPHTAAGAFTGSISGGRALFDIAGARPVPIPFYGELGSINPVVITESAMAERSQELADGLAASFTLGAGQFCTKPGVVFIPARSRFTERVVAAASKIAPARMLNDRILAGFRRGERELENLADVRGVGRAGHGGESDRVAPRVFSTTSQAVRRDPGSLLDEVFGPAVLLVEYESESDLLESLDLVPGSLTGTVHAGAGEDVRRVVEALSPRVGRLLFAGWPTGVAVSWAQNHGGPYPAATSLFTSVGATAIRRFLRPLTYQSATDSVLPPPLQEANPWRIPRRVDGSLELSAGPLGRI
jgi:NADP-dependent aldehyde dehydrogenase